MSFAQSIDERLSDVARSATRGAGDCALVELRDTGDRHRAVARSARADAGLVAALRAWEPDASRSGALARAFDDALRRGAARLLRQLDLLGALPGSRTDGSIHALVNG